uniref:Uncharacterized protein n=2 Tax=Arcella intermedia TaxID=1963864 RepID=A0A6B2LKV4_9EUKA
MAEDEWVTILPSFNHPTMHFISGDIGPFEVSIPINVPLWLAITLKKRKMCNIKPPSWMTTENIRSLVQREKSLEGFQQLPSLHLMEISFEILKYASEDLIASNEKDIDELRVAIEDLFYIRNHKIRNGFVTLGTEDISLSSIKLNGIQSMELNNIRPIFTETLQVLAEFDKHIDSTFQAKKF